MRKKNEREPRTKKRYQVYIIKGTQSFFSKNYKTPRGAYEAAERLNKKFGYLGYEAEIKTVEEVI